MALNWSLNFVSAQYLQNTWAELGEALHMLWYRQAGIVTCQFSPICNLWPLIDVGIRFPLDIMRRKGYNFTQFFICIYIGKIFDGILPVGFHKFVTELKLLIDSFRTWNAL